MKKLMVKVTPQDYINPVIAEAVEFEGRYKITWSEGENNNFTEVAEKYNCEVVEICDHCGEIKSTIKRRKQNTTYQDDELNYITVCDECFEEIESNWADMWKKLGR